MVNDTELRSRLGSDLGITDLVRWTTPELLLWHQRKVLNKEGLGLEDLGSIDFTVLTPKALDNKYQAMLSVMNYGAVGDGIADDSLALTNCISAAVAVGAVAFIPAGIIIRRTSQLVLSANTKLCVDGRIKLDYVAGSGPTVAFIVTSGIATPTKQNDIKIWGKGFIAAASIAQTGSIFCLYGDRTQISDITIDCFAGGRAYLLSGDYIRMYNPLVYGAAPVIGNGGIRVVGGKGFRCFGAKIDCGDDCLQFVPSGNSADPLFDQSIDDGYYIGCNGDSSAARVCAIGTQSSTGVSAVVNMTCSVTNCGFINIAGRGGAAGVVIQNLNSSGKISRIILDNVLVDNLGGNLPGGTVYITCDNTGLVGIGPVEFVHLRRVKVTNSPSVSISIVGPWVYDTTIEDCYAERSTVDPTQYVMNLSGQRTKVIRGTYDGKGSAQHVISMNTNTAAGIACTEPLIENARVIGIGPAFAGVFFANSQRPTARRNKFEEFAGAVTALGLWATNTSVDLTIIENVWATLTNASKFTNSSTGTLINSNNR